MKTKEEIEQELARQRRDLRSAGDYRDWDGCDKHGAWVDALRWVLEPSKNYENQRGNRTGDPTSQSQDPTGPERS